LHYLLVISSGHVFLNLSFLDLLHDRLDKCVNSRKEVSLEILIELGIVLLNELPVLLP